MNERFSIECYCLELLKIDLLNQNIDAEPVYLKNMSRQATLSQLVVKLYYPEHCVINSQIYRSDLTEVESAFLDCIMMGYLKFC